MMLASGTRLGPYEIVAPLGAGGMGEVFRARDTKLDREVAIKVLPELFAADPERLARFEREAKTLAALNHPHIAQIYGLEQSSTISALVMELVEGDDLAERIARGPLSLDDALAIAKQIAEALEEAHEQGIIHRDLKPPNIKVRPDGTVKVLDFGLAKALEPSSVGAGLQARPNLTQSPTISLRATSAGVILGTACYMAPEQASGQTVDRRCDIWSFGVVLWEMLCGTKLFGGETLAHTLADLLRAEIDWRRLPAATPPAMRELLRRCLERDRRKRLQAIGDARVAIEEMLAGIATPIPTDDRSTARAWLPWVVAGVGTAAALTLALTQFRREQPAAPRPVRFQMRLPEGIVPRPVAPAVSPDGSRVVFLADSPSGMGSDSRLWIHSFDSLDSQPLPGTEGASGTFWSPDGRFIAFFANGKLKKLDAAGGAVQVVCDAPPSTSGAWGADDIIVIASRQSGFARVSASGGTPEPLRFEARSDRISFLPDGRHFLYSDAGFTTRGRGVFVASLDQTASPATPLLPDVSFATYAAPGYVLYTRGERLVAHRFDLERLTLTGDPITIAQTATFFPGTPVASASGNGVLAYASVSGGLSNLVWFDRSGRQLGSLAPASVYGHPALSPDGGSVVVETRSGDGATLDLYRIDVARKISVRLTSSAESASPVWAPDGKTIAFTSTRDQAAGGDLYRRPAGVGDDKLILSGPTTKYVCDWSPDGRSLLYYEFAEKTGRDLWVLPLTGERKPWPYVKSAFEEYGGQFSPDGEWVAYTSNETGQFEVYVQRFGSPTAAGEKIRISSQGGAQPRWRRDGRELFYLSPDMTVMAVDIERGPALRSGIPHVLFRRPQPGIGFTNWGIDYAVSADGQRFLVNVADAASRATPITVILNWTAALQRP
jgi:serine/threonine protein kinase